MKKRTEKLLLTRQTVRDLRPTALPAAVFGGSASTNSGTELCPHAISTKG
jgi:hypothetical protein